MTLAALNTQEAVLWQITLVVGAVVLIVVIALLTLLLHLVRSIELAGGRLLGVAQEVAGNTTRINDVNAVVSTLEEIGDEADQHARLLGAAQ